MIDSRTAFFSVLCTLAFSWIVCPHTAESTDLIQDDFSRYPTGLLSYPVAQMNPAIQEYHYLAHRGVPLEPWANAIGYLDSWLVGTEDGKPYLEQHFAPDHRRMEPELFSPLFITGAHGKLGAGKLVDRIIFDMERGKTIRQRRQDCGERSEIVLVVFHDGLERTRQARPEKRPI